MQALGWIIVFLAACAVGCAYQIQRIRRSNVYWRGSMLCFTDAKGSERLRSMTEVVTISEDQFGRLVVQFEDSEAVTLYTDAKGVAELCGRIVEISQR